MRAYGWCALIGCLAVAGCHGGSSTSLTPEKDVSSKVAAPSGPAKKAPQGMGLPGLGPGAKDADTHVGSKAGG